MRNLRNQWVIGVCISQQRTYGKQHLRYGESRRPLVLEDVERYIAVGVDVWVVDSGGKSALGRLEGVVCWKMNV